MDYEIKYKPSYAMLVIKLEANETVTAEAGAMTYMEPSIDIKTRKRERSLLGTLGLALLGGQSFFVNDYTAKATPAEAAPAPWGLTYTTTGTRELSMDFTMVLMDEARPPGVSSRIITKTTPLSSAFSRPLVRNVAVAGPIAPSKSMIITSRSFVTPWDDSKNIQAKKTILIKMNRKRPKNRRLCIFFDLQSHMLHDLLDIIPHLPLCRWVSEQIGRMIGGHQRDIHKRMPPPSLTRYFEFPSQKGLGSYPTKGADDLRADQIELCL